MPSGPVSLDHVNIYVRNVDRSRRWYADVLGLHITDSIDGPDGKPRIAFLSGNPDHGHDIALAPAGENAPGPQKAQVGLNHFALKMANLEDLKEMYHRLKEKGVAIHRVSDHGIAMGIYFQDPDGNGLETYYELPRAEWGRDRPFSGGATGRFPGPWDEMLQAQAAAPASARR